MVGRSFGRRAGTACLLALIAVAIGADRASAYDPRAERGQRFAAANCSGCHAIGKHGKSPLAIAPPFRTLHERYPIDDLAEAFAEGIVTGHPTMPQFKLEPDQIDNLLAYLKTL